MLIQDNNTQTNILARRSTKTQIEKPQSETQREIEDSYNQFNNQISSFKIKLCSSSKDFQQYLNSVQHLNDSVQKPLKPLKAIEYGKIKKNSYYNKNIQHFNFNHQKKYLQTPQHIPIQKIPFFKKNNLEYTYKQKTLDQLDTLKDKLQKYTLPQIDLKADKEQLQNFIENQSKMNQKLKETIQNNRIQRQQNSCVKSTYSKIENVTHQNQQQLL